MIIITDTYSQPDAPDPVLAEDRVLELARRHAGSVRKVTFIDESGGEARAYMCDDDLVLKTQRPQQLRPRTSLEKEAFILGQIAAQDALPIPRVIGYGREDDAEYLLMTRIPASPWNPRHCPAPPASPSCDSSARRCGGSTTPTKPRWRPQRSSPVTGPPPASATGSQPCSTT